MIISSLMVFHHVFYTNNLVLYGLSFFFFFQAEDGIRDYKVTGVQTCALPILPLHVWLPRAHPAAPSYASALMSGVMLKMAVYGLLRVGWELTGNGPAWWGGVLRSEEHTSELQSPCTLVCRLLLAKKHRNVRVR